MLCRAERVTGWHAEEDELWIADCLVCRTPMIVWRTHGLPDQATERALLDRLEAVALDVYGEDGYWIDPIRRRIPDHWHAHARPVDGFFGPADPARAPTTAPRSLNPED